MKLTAADAGYAIGAAELLHGISLDINPGELIIAVGPNGAGKSTMMKLLSGEIFPSLGQVAIDGIDLKQWQLRKLARIMAVLPQQSELNFPFRVHEVVSLGRIPHATGRHRDLEIVEELLVKFGCVCQDGRAETAPTLRQAQGTTKGEMLAGLVADQ